MKFQPGEKDTESAPEEKNIWKYPIFSKSSKNTESTLDTPYTDIELRKKLYSLQNKSRTVFEEQGYPTLYLALGFVQWTENESSKPLKAPLLLLPVDLERQKIKENYTLKWTGEDPVVSLSLSAKFAEQGVELPDLGHPETSAEVGEFFNAVEETIKSKGWTLCPEIVLDLFSFKKYVMFRDLDPASWGEDFSIEDNPLIDSIFNPTESPAETAEIPTAGEHCFNIVDADSSQLAVIRDAKAGKNLVVEGPPGTGKSQTIANMIAEMLSAGKTVLFVSEKMAALEVVKRRLDGAGLSRFCLELHSQTAKKVEFIRELERCIQHPTSLRQNHPTQQRLMRFELNFQDTAVSCASRLVHADSPHMTSLESASSTAMSSKTVLEDRTTACRRWKFRMLLQSLLKIIRQQYLL